MLEFKNLTCFYGKNIILSELSFKLEKNTITSILGANGSGKSTLLKALMGINKYQGQITYENQNLLNVKLKNRSKIFAYVPQNISIPFEFSVEEVVLMGRFCESSLGIGYKKEDYEIARESLKKVGALKLRTRIFKYLSGGEKQLTFIARALAQNSDVIVLDEPTTGLDLGNQMKLLEMLTELKNDNKTIIQTTHYPDHALRVSDNVAWLHDKHLFAFGKPKEVITKERIALVYKVECDFLEYKNRYNFLLPLDFVTNVD